jgi:hypothetical protein
VPSLHSTNIFHPFVVLFGRKRPLDPVLETGLWEERTRSRHDQ